MKRAALQGIAYHLPEAVLSNEQLAEDFPDWDVSKIEKKVGIVERRMAAADECSSDLGVKAAEKLFAAGVCQPDDIDFVLFCTQSPDYFLPTTACMVQQRLGIPTSAGALDFNLGCSGFVYGLSLAKGLVETGQASNVLLITAETYSKFVHPGDKSVRTLFGDAAAASLVTAVDSDHETIGPFVFGTDGSGAENLIVPAGGMRQPLSATTGEVHTDAQNNTRSAEHLYMNGAAIFTFTLRMVPQTVKALLDKAALPLDEIDRFVFHQANQYMLQHLRRRLKIPEDKFVLALRHCGNTVSSTIPIALRDARDQGQIQPGQKVMLVGFGVGLSWGATLLEIPANFA